MATGIASLGKAHASWWADYYEKQSQGSFISIGEDRRVEVYGDFDTVVLAFSPACSRGFLNSYKMICPCPCLSDADWRVQSASVDSPSV